MDTDQALDHQNRPDANRFDGAEAASGAPVLRGRGAEIAAADTFTIREMASDFGVSIRALRFYEDRGLLHPRREGAIRLYGDRDRRDLKSILKGKQLGFTLTEIGDMLQSRHSPLLAVGSHKDSVDLLEVEETDLELALPPEQIVAQLGYLERQRKELDAAIIALRNAHRRMLETPGRAAIA